MNDKSVHICNWCNQQAELIWVHGHCQCSVCRINVDECCRGEEAHPPAPRFWSSASADSAANCERGSSLTASLREEEKDKND